MRIIERGKADKGAFSVYLCRKGILFTKNFEGWKKCVVLLIWLTEYK